jgi:acyl carrier protein
MNMNPDALHHSIIEVLSDLSRIAPERIKLTDRLCDDLSLDSLQRMEALSRISDQYHLDPDLEQVMALKTVGDVIGLMKSAV